MWSLAMVVTNNEIVEDKNAGKLLATLIVMRMRQYDVGHIAQLSTSRASLEATGCRHWASDCPILPLGPPGSLKLVENTKTLTKHNF